MIFFIKFNMFNKHIIKIKMKLYRIFVTIWITTIEGEGEAVETDYRRNRFHV